MGRGPGGNETPHLERRLILLFSFEQDGLDISLFYLIIWHCEDWFSSYFLSPKLFAFQLAHWFLTTSEKG